MPNHAPFNSEFEAPGESCGALTAPVVTKVSNTEGEAFLAHLKLERKRIDMKIQNDNAVKLAEVAKAARRKK